MYALLFSLLISGAEIDKGDKIEMKCDYTTEDGKKFLKGQVCV